jgi:hypothetical protein
LTGTAWFDAVPGFGSAIAPAVARFTMRNKLIIVAVALAGVLGLAAVVRQAGGPKAQPPTATEQAAPDARPLMAPAPTAPAPQSRASRSAAQPQAAPGSSAPRTVTTTRSKKKSAAIIAGSAGAGAAVGAIAGGGKGAAIGAITGGVGGVIYDQATRRKTRTER